MQRFALILFLIAGVYGCRERGKPVVGVIPKGANHIFWQTVHAGAIKAGQEFGLDIEWNAPTLEIDASRQIAIVESMVNKRLAGIALAPVDRKALVHVVERAMNSKIPVAIFDSDIDTAKRITYVATNNREGGRMAARRLGELMRGAGKCAIIGFMPGSASTMEREEGFQQELKAKYPNIKIVQTVFGMASRAQAKAATENILTAHPDLGGLFADNESSSAGAVLALRSRGISSVRMVAFDANQQIIDELRDRLVDAVIIQDPMKMGYESVKALAMKLRGEAPAQQIDSGVYLVDRSNIESPDTVQLLYPDIQRYLQASR